MGVAIGEVSAGPRIVNTVDFSTRARHLDTFSRDFARPLLKAC
jgi:hypothetical protein